KRGKEEGPCDCQEKRARHQGKSDGGSNVGPTEPEDRAEQDAYARGAVPGTFLGGEDRQKEDAEAQRPGEEGADGHVICVGLVSEQADDDRAEDRRGEDAREDVEPQDGGRQAARKSDVAKSVAGEDLGSEDDEVADQSAGEPDESAGDQRVAHELVREHQAASSASRAVARSLALSTRPARTSTWSPNEREVT